MFNKLRIGAKFIFSFGIITALMITLAIVALYSFSSVTQTTKEVVSGIDVSNRANTVIDTANEMRRAFLLYLGTRDSKLSATFDGELKKVIETTQEIVDKMRIPEDKQVATEMMEFAQEIKSRKEKFFSMESQLQQINDSYYSTADKLSSLFGATLKIVHEKTINTGKKDESGNIEVDEAKTALEQSLLQNQVLLQQRISLRLKFANAYSDEDRRTYQKELADYAQTHTALMNAIQPLLPEGDAAKNFQVAVQTMQQWNEIAASHTTVTTEQADEQKVLLTRFFDTIHRCQNMVKQASEEVNRDVSVQQSVISYSQNIIYVVSVVAFAVAVLMGVLLTRSVVGGISGIVNLFKRITKEGDTEIVIDDKYMERSDEVGDLAQQAQEIIRDFRSVTDLGQSLSRGDWTYRVRIKGEKDKMNQNLTTMLEQVNNVLHQVSNSVQQVSAGAGQVAATSETLSQGATESAASLEEITSSMTEMGSQTRQNAQNAAEASHLANDASKAAENGQEMMKQMITSMEQITTNSQDVQKVIKVIDDISFQTNLLALNAAVEAARAGVHGKGFAVVAEEVRNLAARCAKAAGETTQMIENNNRQIQEGAEIAHRTAEMLDQIVSQVSNTTNLINEIATASNEQAQGVNQVSQALQQIDTVTQQNTASAEESASASNEMNSYATKLQQVVSRFKLRDSKITGETTASNSLTSEQESNFEANRVSSGRHSGVKKVAAKSIYSDSDDGWNTATAILDNEPDYNFKLDDSEFGKY
ncbi:MAG: methyl-accepting chemotaxis protein [Planctomycetaceae bacterium]|nr:methyl-accepting chemotaxis protein [Planctomycetaceae bacterium]